jgi:hypothetical protein
MAVPNHQDVLDRLVVCESEFPVALLPASAAISHHPSVVVLRGSIHSLIPYCVHYL